MLKGRAGVSRLLSCHQGNCKKPEQAHCSGWRSDRCWAGRGVYHVCRKHCFATGVLVWDSRGSSLFPHLLLDHLRMQFHPSEPSLLTCCQWCRHLLCRALWNLLMNSAVLKEGVLLSQRCQCYGFCLEKDEILQQMCGGVLSQEKRPSKAYSPTSGSVWGSPALQW